jgi:hypothetical protein
MSYETDTTSLTELLTPSVVEQTIQDYLIDANVISPLVKYRNIAGLGTKVVNYPTWTKDSGSDITESTGLTANTLLETSHVQVTAAQVGILREITDFVAATNVLGEQALFDAVVSDGVALCKEMLEDDLAALFASLTGALVGTDAADFSIANFVEAIAKLRTIKARGQYVCVLDDQAAYDLMAAVAASAATGLNNNVDQSVLNAGSDGYVGSLMGVPVWMTNLTDTDSSAADVISAMFVSGSSNPKYCPLAWTELWAPRVRQVPSPAMPSVVMSVTYAYGVGCVYPAAGVQIQSDA